MLKNYYKVIVILFLFCFFSCFKQKIGIDIHEDLTYKNNFLIEITDELFFAIPTRDKTKILDVSNKISDIDIINEGNTELIKLKLLALTFCGEYENAFNEVIKSLEFYPNDYELHFAKGLLGEILNINTFGFHRSIEIIEEEIKYNQSDELIIMNYYLHLLLFDIKIDNSILELYNNNEFVHEILLLFSTINYKEDLLLVSPISFIIPKPLYIDKINNVDEWWILFD